MYLEEALADKELCRVFPELAFVKEKKAFMELKDNDKLTADQMYNIFYGRPIWEKDK
jgi:hypothetical protein